MLRTALAQVLRADVAPVLTVAGRTDAGVHASGQVVHVDVEPAAWQGLPGRSGNSPSTALVTRLAGVLPADVRVVAVAEAPAGFDARFSALRRRYAYRLDDRPGGPPPLRRHEVVAARRPLDVAAMGEASRALLGLHDFAAFCRRRAGATTLRTLLAYDWRRDADGLVVADVVADAFCHSMVRALVGASLAVGLGRREVAWPAQVLAGGVRDPRVTVAPARGLVLREVTYPPAAEMAARAAQARVVRTQSPEQQSPEQQSHGDLARRFDPPPDPQVV